MAKKDGMRREASDISLIVEEWKTLDAFCMSYFWASFLRSHGGVDLGREIARLSIEIPKRMMIRQSE